jgi:hypothetical protein
LYYSRSKEFLGATQAFRWGCFERSPSEDKLRAYLMCLPDFDDIEAEERALSFVLDLPKHHPALSFLVDGPALAKAARPNRRGFHRFGALL